MALAEDVIALVQELSSTELAVTLVGSPVTPEETTEPHILNTQKKEQENEKFEEKKKHTYSAMSEEVCPTRDREVLQKKLAKKIDVRYINEIKSFKDKFKASYLMSCNQQQCPTMQQRMNQHQHDYHRDYRNTYIDCTKHRDQGINVSPTLSRMRLPKFNVPQIEEVQTDITMSDFSPNRLHTPYGVIVPKTEDEEVPLRKSETREVLPKKNFYKEHLQNEILNWLQCVPMFFTLNFTTKDIKENIINNLAEKINKLATGAYDKQYEIKAKIEIENCLCRLPMWLPGSKQEQNAFKDGLREKLWRKIQELNRNFLGIKNSNITLGFEIDDPNEDTSSLNFLDRSYEKEVADWSQKLQLTGDQTSLTRRQIVDLIMKRLTPLLKIPLHTTSYKLILKGEIIDILDDLPLTLSSPKYKTVHLNRFAEELANRLLSIQIKQEASNSKLGGKNTTVLHHCVSQVLGVQPPRLRNFRKAILEKVTEILNRVQVCHRQDLKTEICTTFLDSQGNVRTGDEMAIQREICQFLRDTGKVPVDRTLTVAKMIIKHVKTAIKDFKNTTTTSFDSVMPELSGTLSVYRWGDKQPTTSTPKKPSKKEIPKLNFEERSYMENVAGLIRTWMDTLPKQFNENKTFKETIINDLAGDIMDQLKVEQLAPETRTDKDKYLNYLMYRWLYRFEFFDDDTIRNDAKPYIADFLVKLKEITVPRLTAPQHGTRQAMGNIRHMEGEHGWEEDYVPKGIDVLEDQISVWLNEQPSEIYVNKEKRKREKHIHDLALTLQDRLRNKNPESEIDEDINQWLKKLVNSKEKENIGLLTQDLKEKVINVPQDQTLEARYEDKKRQTAERAAAKRQIDEQSSLPTQDISNFGNVEGDPDETIREFIAKFIEHNYDIDDPMARGAFSHLLKVELRKLAPPIRREIYDNFEKSKPHEQFSPDQLRIELEYIKIISDWLNNLPIDPSYNKPGNQSRIEFVNDLARNVTEVEDQRSQNPHALDYDYLLASIIIQNMHSYGLPILPEHKDNTPIMVGQLLKKLQPLRGMMPCCTYDTQPLSPAVDSLTMSDIKEQDLSEFVADYIRINGRDIDDQVKLEAWTERLLQELKKMTQAGQDPNKLNKAEVFSRFSEVPIPTSESVRHFSLKLDYIKEISDWLKNLPIKLIANDPKAEEERILMMSELAEKMAERDALRNSDPNDNKADKDLVEYTTKWISRLPLESCKQIDDVPVVIQQLMNRMEKVNRRKEWEKDPLSPRGPDFSINPGGSPPPLTTDSGGIPNENSFIEGSEVTCKCKMQKTASAVNDSKKVECECAKAKESKESKGDNVECECNIMEETEPIPGNIEAITINTEGGNSESPKEPKTITASTENDNIKCGCKSPKEPKTAKFERDNVKNDKETKDQKAKSTEQKISTESIKEKLSKIKLSPCCKSKKRKPGSIIVESIEGWSNKLPIKANSVEEENSIKQGIARKLYQKVGELNVDPKTFNDDLLYRDMLSDEIDTQLENVPQNPELQKNREKLKEALLNTILDTKQIIKEKSAGDNYKHKLETTINASIPNPVQSKQAFDPGFEIYKNRLADMFILENFDHANDDVKSKYEQRVRFEIDKYFESARNKNALPLTNDQMYNELYSVLFKVPMPNESAVIDEVEQIKTRCEIDAWFETLPLKQADNLSEMLEWNKILSTLTKKIHEIERSEARPEAKLQIEIMKWLEKLPLLPGHKGLDYHANYLRDILMSTAEARKYVAAKPLDKIANKGKGKKSKDKKDKKDKGNTSHTAGPRSGVQRWISQKPPQSKATFAKPCVVGTPMTRKKPGDIIVEVVEEWCNQLPLTSSEDNNRLIRDNISTRIIIHISELNMDPEVFNDDLVYDELFDEELENVLSNLPVPNNFERSKGARKYQLKEQIKSIKPLLKEEKARHEYKEELNSTVVSIIKEPQDTNAEKTALFNKLKDEIVENFVQYYYNRNDESGRRLYKNKVHDAVVKYFLEIRDKGIDEKVDPLVRRNQLLCELAKIPIPNQALREEVDEINMRKEVQQLFNELDVPDEETESKMMKNLAKRLNDLEKSGYDCEIEKKMKADIFRCLKKLNKEPGVDAVENFVLKLKLNEAERKTPPMSPSQAEALNKTSLPGSPRAIHNENQYFPQSYSYNSQRYGTYHVIAQSGEEEEEQWSSSPSDSPLQMDDASYDMPYDKLYLSEYDSQTQYDTFGRIINETVKGAFDTYKTEVEVNCTYAADVCDKYTDETGDTLYDTLYYRPKDEDKKLYTTIPVEKRRIQSVYRIMNQNIPKILNEAENKELDKQYTPKEEIKNLFTLDHVEKSMNQTVNRIMDLVVDRNMDVNTDRSMNYSNNKPSDKLYEPKDEAINLYVPNVADKSINEPSNNSYRTGSEASNLYALDTLNRDEYQTVERRVNQTNNGLYNKEYMSDAPAKSPHKLETVVQRQNQSVKRDTNGQYECQYRPDAEASNRHCLESAVKKLNKLVEKSINQNIPSNSQYRHDAKAISRHCLETVVKRLNQSVERSMNQNQPTNQYRSDTEASSPNGLESGDITLNQSVDRTMNNSYTTINTKYDTNIETRSLFASNHVDRGMNHTEFSYEDFSGRIISSCANPQSYSAPLGKVPVNDYVQRGPVLVASSRISDGHTQPSSEASQRSKRRSHNVKEVPVAPIQKRVSYGQMATPRQVARGPHQVANTPHDVVPLGFTPDSAFNVSLYKQTPLHLPLHVPVIQPVPRSSILSLRSSRRLLQLPNAERALVPRRGPHPMADCNFESSDEEEIICTCNRCIRKMRKGVPFCMVSMEECYDNLVGPMWCRLHYPEFYYY